MECTKTGLLSLCGTLTGFCVMSLVYRNSLFNPLNVRAASENRPRCLVYAAHYHLVGRSLNIN